MDSNVVTKTMASPAPSPAPQSEGGVPRGKKLALAAALWTLFFLAVVFYFSFGDNANVWADAFPAIALGAIVCLRVLRRGASEAQD